MSFLFDLPVLFIIGSLLYLLGNKFKLKRLSKITIGTIIVSCFIVFSMMLYFDVFYFVFPPIGWNMKGSFFMFSWPLHLPIAWFTKEDAPGLIVIFLFLLYPLSIYSGYAVTLLTLKRHSRNILKESKSYKDVKSRKRIAKIQEYSVIRYPDNKNGVSGLKDGVEKAIEDLGGMKKFVKNGDRVLIKVNICGGIPDNPGTFTSKEVVGYVVDLIREAGGSTIVICDADMIWTKFWENAKAIGWDKWAEEKKVELINLSETELAYFDFGEGTVFQHNEKPDKEIVSTEMLKADVIISIPKMKTHLLTGVTLGMKNMYGTFPDEDKARYHQRGINEVIYWVNYAFTPDLTLIDGTIGGEAIGPLSVNDIPYNTVIASNSVAVADAVASKLMGFDHPFEDIEHLKLTEEKELLKPAKERVLLREVPTELELSVTGLIRDLPEDSKDGNWIHPDPEVAKKYENLMENLLTIPYLDTFFNIGADFLLFDLARIPILKYFNIAILQFLYEAPRFWASETVETNLSKRTRRINLAAFSLISLISIFFFLKNGYLSASPLKSSLWVILGFILAIILGAWFSRDMKTKNVIGIILSSMVVALFVESFAPIANWWRYFHEYIQLPGFIYETSSHLGISIPRIIPSYPLFSIPIFIIAIIGISYFIFRPIFAYVDLKGERFNLIPFAVVTILLFALLFFEGNLAAIGRIETQQIVAIYIVLWILGLYYNRKQSLDWNLSVAIIAVTLGGAMEFLGAIAGFWGYPLTWDDPTKFQGFIRLPIYVSLTWALNTWAACGLAQIFKIDMIKAFSDANEAFDVEDAEAWINKGDDLADKGEYKEAIKYYDGAIEIEPKSKEAWINKGCSLNSYGDFQEALKACDKALEIDLQDANALYARAGILQNLNRCEEAQKAYDEAIKLNSGSVDGIDIHVDKALSLQQLGKFEDSLELLNKALTEDIPSDPIISPQEISIFRGFANIDLGNIAIYGICHYEEAIKDFEKAIALNSEEELDQFWLANALLGKGYALARLGKYDEFNDTFNKLYMYHDSSALIYLDKGSALMDQGRYEEALKSFDKSIQLGILNDNVQTDQAWRNRGATLSKIIAQALLNKGEALQMLGHKYNALQAYENSMVILDYMIRMNPKDADVWNSKGYILHKMNTFNEALKAYDQAIEIAKEAADSPEPFLGRMMLAKAWIGKGSILAAEGRNDEAIDSFDMAINAAPNNLLSWAYKSISFKEMGNLEEAQKAFDRASDIASASGYSLSIIGKGLVLKAKDNQGESDDKLQNQENTHFINPRYTDLWLHRSAYLSMFKFFDRI